MTDPVRPAGSFALAGGWCWFDRVEVLSRAAPPRLIPATALPEAALHRLSAPRTDFAGLTMDRPRLMGIVNTTPDSFSDGGRYLAQANALEHARFVAHHAEMVDIGGESTRPGSLEVPVAEEIARTAPVIEALRDSGMRAPISIDTRKALVASAALAAGATVINDVSGLDFDPAMGGLVAQTGAALVLMHAQGLPETMQNDPQYGDVLLDVYDALADRLARAVALGIDPARIAIDPGIGFGKTMAHNIALLRAMSLFHGLGCPLLVGTSRKRFIGTIGRAETAEDRMPGSVAVALAGFAQGVQLTRVHDVAETRQALLLWQALHMDQTEGQA